MTKTLTDQWRDGKLPNGDYYIKVRGRLTKKDFYAYDNCINGKWAYTLDGNIIDIIEKVPSYEKYNELVQKMHTLEKKLEIATKALERINDLSIDNDGINDGGIIWCALNSLKEMEGVK